MGTAVALWLRCYATNPKVAGSIPAGEFLIYIKVKQSHYRPGQAQRVLRKLRFPHFLTTAQDGGKVVSLTHRSPLPPGNVPGTHFC